MYKVLLVEDEILVREAIAENIVWNEIGLELIASCKNGKEAIEIIEEEVPDIVITDICMPYVDGMQLSEYIYKKFPETKIIIFSGYDEFEYAKQALHYKVEEYLLKPITAQELTQLLIKIRDKINCQRQEKKDIKRLKGTYYKYLNTIRSQVLNDLILGNKDEQEYRDEMKEFGIQLSKRYLKVAIIDTEISYSVDFVTDHNQNQSTLLLFAIYNIVNEIMDIQSLGLTFQQKDRKIMLIFESNLKEHFDNEVKSVCEIIQEKIRSYLEIEVFIAIGKKVEKLSEIYLSYEEAYELISYSYLYDCNSIISKCEIDSLRKETDVHIYIERILLQVKRQFYKELELEVETLLKEIKKAYLKKEEVIIIMQNIIAGANDILKLAGVEKRDKEGRDEQWIYEFEREKNIYGAFEIMKKYLNSVVDQLGELKEDTGKKQTLLALDFIEKNYQNSELTLQMICKYLSMSPSYFSAIFKKETGETFVEVLTKKRMQVAKNLLKYTSLKNYEIAEKIGFSDAHYFSQTFKKYIGKTPKEYAKESRDAL